jgi:serine O-acetyltransferase
MKAEKVKFSAYAVGNDENDPINKALQPLLAEIQTLKEQLANLTDTKSETKVAGAFTVKKTKRTPRKITTD